MSEEILYFAYGSNMSQPRLGARTPSARVRCVATLPGYELRFHKLSREDGSGKCDIVFTGDPGHTVFGVVYSLHLDELPALDAAEGVGLGYEREPRTVYSLSGEALETHVYIATLTRSELRPMDWYKEHVLRGAHSHQLPEDYIAMIEAVQAHPDPDRERRSLELSVYGS